MESSSLKTGLLALTLIALPVAAQEESDQNDEDESRRYTTREERRELGPRYNWGERLFLRNVLEWEYEQRQRNNLDEDERAHDNDWALENELLLVPWRNAQVEVITEYDNSRRKLRIDEALAAFEYSAWEVELGRLYLPFGEYFSHFATGPLLEFGETRARALILSWKAPLDTEWAVFSYRGRARKADNSRPLAWGSQWVMAASDDLEFGLGYLSNLADSDERFLEDFGNRYQRPVPAATAYLLGGGEAWEFNLEWLAALASFRELEAHEQRPRAWNLEFSVYPIERLGLSLRHEGSQDLADEPRRRSGVAASLQLWDSAFLTVEALRSQYSPPGDDEDEPQADDWLYAAQFSLGF